MTGFPILSLMLAVPAVAAVAALFASAGAARTIVTPHPEYSPRSPPRAQIRLPVAAMPWRASAGLVWICDLIVSAG